MVKAVIIGLISSCSMANACPNFSGQYEALGTGENIEVVQVGCSSILITSKPALPQPPVRFEFIIDGKVRLVSSLFLSARWVNDKFVREPWSAETQGEMIGMQEVWTYQSDSSILKEIIDPSDSGVISSDTLVKK